MTSVPPFDKREQLAAEQALGVLDGADRTRAERLIADDAGFAARVEWWHERLAPLLDDIAAVSPSPELWVRINAALDNARDGANDGEGARATNVIPIERALRRWKGLATAFGAIAAALAVVLVLPDAQTPLPAPSAATPAPMTAAIAAAGATPSFTLAYSPADRSLTVIPAAVSPVAGHSHELWVIPQGGKPIALGVIDAAKPMRMTMPAAMAPHMTGTSTLAVSAEPLGGSPTGQPTGPVIGSGQLQTV